MQVVVRILNLGLGVVVTAIVVRTLGTAGYGQWSTALVILGLLGYFVSFGLDQVALREAARTPEYEHEWVGALIMLRFVMVLPITLLSAGLLLVLAESHEMLVSGLILMLGTIYGSANAIVLLFQLRVDNRVPMLVITLRSVLWGAAVVVIAATGGDMIAFAIAMVVTNAVGSAVQFGFAFRLGARWPRPSRKRLGSLLRIGLPIGISGILIIAYARLDQMIVFVIRGSQEAGLYGAVYNVLEQSHFVPLSILTTLAPVLAAAWPSDRRRLIRTTELTVELMAVTGFGALAFVIVAAKPIVQLIFGPAFTSAAGALPVLGGAYVLICFGYLNGNLMLVLGLQRRILDICLAALVVNLVGNLALVPVFGYMAAAWMTLLTEAVVFVPSLVLIMRKLELTRPPAGRIGRTLAAAVLLGAVLAVLRALGAPFSVLVAAACVSYPAFLFALRALDLDDLRTLLRRGAAPA